jgi:hypothetical protein
MIIDRLYKFAQVVSNNHLNGNLTSSELKLQLHNSVLERYEENIYELNKLLNRERRGQVSNFSVENLVGKIRERILHYYEPADLVQNNGKVVLPADLRYLDTVEIGGIDAEASQNRRHFKSIQNFQDTAPTDLCPIYYRLNNSIEVLPVEEGGSVSVFYLRNPKVANWTYQLIPRSEDPSKFVEAFDPDHPDFQDVDIHPSEEYTISMKLLQRLGVNLSKEQLAQYGLTKEGIDLQNENIN